MAEGRPVIWTLRPRPPGARRGFRRSMHNDDKAPTAGRLYETPGAQATTTCGSMTCPHRTPGTRARRPSQTCVLDLARTAPRDSRELVALGAGTRMYQLFVAPDALRQAPWSRSALAYQPRARCPMICSDRNGSCAGCPVPRDGPGAGPGAWRRGAGSCKGLTASICLPEGAHPPALDNGLAALVALHRVVILAAGASFRDPPGPGFQPSSTTGNGLRRWYEQGAPQEPVQPRHPGGRPARTCSTTVRSTGRRRDRFVAMPVRGNMLFRR